MPAKKLPEDRNLKLLKKAKAEGYFIRCIYVLTCDSNINVARVNLSKFAMLCIFMIILMCLLEFLKNVRPNSFSGKMNIGMKRIFMSW